MKCFAGLVGAILISCLVLMTCPSIAQEPSSYPYLNPKLTPEERAADLVHRMTLEEKASQLVNQARAVPRLEYSFLRLVERSPARCYFRWCYRISRTHRSCRDVRCAPHSRDGNGHRH